MPKSFSPRATTFVITGLGIALLISVFMSPWASSNPDGLDRVAMDHQFEERALEKPVAHRLPFYQWFDQYAVRTVPKKLATPLAGLLGTLITFGLAWSVGKLVTRQSSSPTK